MGRARASHLFPIPKTVRQFLHMLRSSPDKPGVLRPCEPAPGGLDAPRPGFSPPRGEDQKAKGRGCTRGRTFGAPARGDFMCTGREGTWSYDRPRSSGSSAAPFRARR
jgi:hypothetical protein